MSGEAAGGRGGRRPGPAPPAKRGWRAESSPGRGGGPGREAACPGRWCQLPGNSRGRIPRNGRGQRQEPCEQRVWLEKGCARGHSSLASSPLCLAGPQPQCGHLPPLPHQQGAHVEGGASGAAGAGAGVCRPGAGPWLRPCLPGHPPGLCAHCSRSGPPPATTSAAPAALVSTSGETSMFPPQTLTWALPQAENQEIPQPQNPFLHIPPLHHTLLHLIGGPPSRVEIKKTEGQDLSFNKNLRLVSHLGSCGRC